MHFDQGSYFPANFTYLGYVSLVAGSVFMLTGNIVLGLPILLIALGLSFTSVGCSIDIEQKTISDYVSVLGLKFGSPQSYKELKKLIVKESQESQVMSSRGSSTTLHYTIYNAYLFYDDDSVFLTDDKKQERIEAQMKLVAEELSIPFEVL